MAFVYTIMKCKVGLYMLYNEVKRENIDHDVNGIILYTYVSNKSSKSYIINDTQYCKQLPFNTVSSNLVGLREFLLELKRIKWDRDIIIYPLVLSDYMSQISFINDVQLIPKCKIISNYVQIDNIPTYHEIL
jgi:hypothetical protein